MSPHYLALDIGAKRIGLATGSIVAFGRGFIEAEPKEAALNHIDFIVKTEQVTTILLGLPVVKSGEITESQELVRQWGELLKHRFSLPILFVDEAFSSQSAEQQLREEGVDTQKHKGLIDERSAVILLNQYLTERQHLAL